MVFNTAPYWRVRFLKPCNCLAWANWLCRNAERNSRGKSKQGVELKRPKREMGTSVQVKPLCGVYNENPLCYLVSVDGFNFLMDCGWNDHFDPSLLQPLSRSLSLSLSKSYYIYSCPLSILDFLTMGIGGVLISVWLLQGGKFMEVKDAKQFIYVKGLGF